MTPRQRETLIRYTEQQTKELEDLRRRDPEAAKAKARASLVRSGIYNEDGTLHENYVSKPGDMSVRWTKECGEGFTPLPVRD